MEVTKTSVKTGNSSVVTSLTEMRNHLRLTTDMTPAQITEALDTEEIFDALWDKFQSTFAELRASGEYTPQNLNINKVTGNVSASFKNHYDVKSVDDNKATRKNNLVKARKLRDALSTVDVVKVAEKKAKARAKVRAEAKQAKA